jgi:hypothetical protein
MSGVQGGEHGCQKQLKYCGTLSETTTYQNHIPHVVPDVVPDGSQLNPQTWESD